MKHIIILPLANRRISWLILLLNLLIYSQAFATEYHVSKTGNKAATGTAEDPFNTISTAAEVARAGDTITVHEGIYREMIRPTQGGTNDLNRIVYRAAKGEKVVIKGSEVIDKWKKDGPLWKVVLPNSFFKDYNPYAVELQGDWLNKKGINHHTGEVYLNGKALFEKSTLGELKDPVSYPEARNKELSRYVWYAEVGNSNTTIWANFGSFDPNRELVEINVRPSCFYPARTNVNYLTISGFKFDQAATQWAAPTAEQIGLIGTHWSKGWIIENNEISNSKCVGISLGKDRSTGHNLWTHHPEKDGAIHYIEVIFKALEIGWSKDQIGSHIVRNNEISYCGQAGIVGSLGAVFSEVYNNHIHEIWTERDFTGHEMAGIKIHAPIDMLIKNNRIHNTGRGIWIDWMAQGTRITGNLLYDNTTDDLFTEVNHGPFTVDNNLFLSPLSLRDWSEGGHYSHNLFAGLIEFRKVPDRATPYHLPHSTKVAGLKNIGGGDNRFFNNLFVKGFQTEEKKEPHMTQCYGLHGYDKAELPNISEGNIYYSGALPGAIEKNFMTIDRDPNLQFKDFGTYAQISITIGHDPKKLKNEMIRSEKLGATHTSAAIFENYDGSTLIIDEDILGHTRVADNPTSGPFEKLQKGTNNLIIQF